LNSFCNLLLGKRPGKSESRMAGTTGTCYRWRAKFLEWSGTYK